MHGQDRTVNALVTESSARYSRRRPRARMTLMPAFLCLSAAFAGAQVNRPQPAFSQQKPSAIVAPAAAGTAPATQPTPLLQQPPMQATIESTPGSLRIKADNASLTQTLQRIADKTGMKIEGTSGDERVFGNFGPGQPREVIDALLNGTSYNVIMIGALDNGAPRELLLSQKAKGPVTTTPAQQAPTSGDDDTPDYTPPPDDAQPPPTPGRPMGQGPGSQGANGQMQPRTPQELLQQLRSQQMQQQQSQQGATPQQ